jgi:Xaa-Pro aminopeptidase
MMSGDLQYLTGVDRQPHNPTDDNKHGDELYGAFITMDRVVFVVPRMGASAYVRGQAEGKHWISDILVINDGDQLVPFARRLLAFLGNPKTLAVSSRMWTRSALLLNTADPELKFSNASDIIAPMRAVKDAEETRIMKEAGLITDRVFAAVLSQMRLGITQFEIAREVERQIAMHGGSGTSFHTSIYVTGDNIRLVPGPDGKTGFTPLTPGAVVAFDYGITYKGYVSDFGRTVFCGEPGSEYRRYHDYVMKSQATAMQAMVGDAITAAELNSLARQVLEDEGYGSYFTHRLGHGIGIDVHEPPFLYELEDTLLQNGMCFTIEPSIWVPGGPLVRVEDVVQVTPQGGVSFSNFSRELLFI